MDTLKTDYYLHQISMFIKLLENHKVENGITFAALKRFDNQKQNGIKGTLVALIDYAVTVLLFITKPYSHFRCG